MAKAVTASRTSANKPKSVKPKGKPRGGSWKPGQSGNPAGRPKDGESWAAIIKAVGDMYPDDLLQFIGTSNDLGRNLAQFPKSVQMKYLVTTRVFAALMFEPTSGLWKELMERAEGKVPQPIVGGGDDNEPIKLIVEYATKDKSAKPTP